MNPISQLSFDNLLFLFDQHLGKENLAIVLKNKLVKGWNGFNRNYKEYKNLGVVFAFAFVLYSLSMYPILGGQSEVPYYVHLADSFLQGKLYLNSNLNFTFDLIDFNGKIFVPGGILPALLLTPFVAIWGSTLSDIGFGIFLGAINVTLLFSLLRQMGKSVGGLSNQIWMTVLFAAGTVHWWVASIGGFWYLAHTVTVTFMILYVKETLYDSRPGLTGLWLGLAVLARPTTMFSIVFYFSYNYLKRKSLRSIFENGVFFMVSFSFCIGIMLIYNKLRFDNWLDFGYGYLLSGTPRLLEIYNTYGGFNLKYLPCNFYISLFGMPNLFGNPFPGVAKICWHIKPIFDVYSKQNTLFSPLGLGIFFTTPTLLYLFKAKSTPLNLSSGLGGLSILLPLLMYHNTGYFQFGYRYILDLIVFLFVVLASCMADMSGLQKISIVVSVIINFTGFLFVFNFFY